MDILVCSRRVFLSVTHDDVDARSASHFAPSASQEVLIEARVRLTKKDASLYYWHGRGISGNQHLPPHVLHKWAPSDGFEPPLDTEATAGSPGSARGLTIPSGFYVIG